MNKQAKLIKNVTRRATGQTLVGGTGLLIVLVLLGTGLILVTMYDMGFCHNLYFQARMSEVLQQAAAYGVNSSESLGTKTANYNTSAEVRDAVQIICEKSNLPSQSMDDPVIQTIDGTERLVVRGSLGGLPVLISGSVDSVKATAMATAGVSTPPAVAEIAFNGSPRTIVVPSYGHGSGAAIGPPDYGLSWWYYYYNFFDNDSSTVY
jgi:hypothetical protein